jgi:transcriptional regulator with XRE-family HTH domain
MQITTTEQYGKLIRNARKKAKLTQAALAAASGIGERFVRELEKGKPSCRARCAVRGRNFSAPPPPLFFRPRRKNLRTTRDKNEKFVRNCFLFLRRASRKNIIRGGTGSRAPIASAMGILRVTGPHSLNRELKNSMQPSTTKFAED